jgi:hypothetical protein
MGTTVATRLICAPASMCQPSGRVRGDVMAYEMRGQFLEACDCNVMCPCWFEQDPDENECTGIVAWYVEQGQIDGVDVSGLTTVSVSHHGGHRRGAKARVALFLDEGASDEQQRVLTDAFTGKLGGPLGELAEMTDEVATAERAPISFTSDGRTTKVSVGRAVNATMKLLTGSTGRVITVADAALGTVLGTPAEVGKSSRYRLNLGGKEFDRNLEARSANRGRFNYLHQDRARSTS